MCVQILITFYFFFLCLSQYFFKNSALQVSMEASPLNPSDRVGFRPRLYVIDYFLWKSLWCFLHDEREADNKNRR